MRKDLSVQASHVVCACVNTANTGRAHCAHVSSTQGARPVCARISSCADSLVHMHPIVQKLGRHRAPYTRAVRAIGLRGRLARMGLCAAE